jgi:tetratricopeptide (TPR) repeat protein
VEFLQKKRIKQALKNPFEIGTFKMKKKILIVFQMFFLLYGSLSFLSAKDDLKVNTIEKMASEDAKNANDFLEDYNYDKAVEFFNKALSKNISIDNLYGMIKNYADLGKVYILKKDFNKSLEHFSKAIKIIDEEKSFEESRDFVLNGIGEAYYLEKDYAKAKEYFTDAKKITKNSETEAIILLNLAKVDRIEERYDAALEKLLSAERLFDSLRKARKLSNEKNLSLTVYSVGQTYSKKNNYQKAFEYIKKALDLDKMIENSIGIADDYYALGMLEEKFGKKREDSLKYYERSRDIYKAMNNVPQFISLSEKLASIYILDKKYKEYFENKMNIFILSPVENKKDIAKEVLEVLKNREVMNLLDAGKYKTLYDFFNKEAK